MARKTYFVLLFLLSCILSISAQTKGVLYVLSADHVVYDTIKMESGETETKRFGVGKGSSFRFMDIKTDQYVLEFREIDSVSPAGQNWLMTAHKEISFLTKDDTTRLYSVHPELMADHMYYETGIQVSIGTLAIPYKFLFEGKMVPGGTAGASLGVKYIFNPSYTIIGGVAPGIGYVSDDKGEHAAFTIAGFLGAQFGPSAQAAVVIGTDILEDYSHHGKFWISLAVGVELFSL